MNEQSESNYEHVAAWCRVTLAGMGDFVPAHIEKQVAIAKSDSAPVDATFKDAQGRWHTVREIASEELFTKVVEEAQRLRAH